MSTVKGNLFEMLNVIELCAMDVIGRNRSKEEVKKQIVPGYFPVDTTVRIVGNVSVAGPTTALRKATDNTLLVRVLLSCMTDDEKQLAMEKLEEIRSGSRKAPTQVIDKWTEAVTTANSEVRSGAVTGNLEVIRLQ